VGDDHRNHHRMIPAVLFLIASFASSLGGSIKPINPMNSRSLSIFSGVTSSGNSLQYKCNHPHTFLRHSFFLFFPPVIFAAIFSTNPFRDHFVFIISAVDRARSLSLRSAIHLPEVIISP
jgi:hypothetical protein